LELEEFQFFGFGEWHREIFDELGDEFKHRPGNCSIDPTAL